MPRVNIWLPDELAALVKDGLPGVNMSALLQAELRSRLVCEHDELACVRCGTHIERLGLVDEVLSAFYRQCISALEPLVNHRGTAEGAALILKRVAQRHQLSSAEIPLPRPPREVRRSNARTLNRLVDLEEAG